MKLRRLELLRLRGMTPCAVAVPDAPLVVLLGPNAIGKSSLAAAVRGTLFPSADARLTGAEVASTWDDAGRTLDARLAGGRVAWTQDGVPQSLVLPQARLARCFSIGLADLLAEESETDVELAGRLLLELSGGYDVAALEGALFPQLSTRARGEAERALIDARRHAISLGQAARDLAERENGLRRLRDRIESARGATARRAAIDDAIRLAQTRERVSELESERAALPAAARLVRDDEAERFETAEDAAERAHRLVTSLEETRHTAGGALAAASFPHGPLAAEALAERKERIRELAQLESDLAKAAEDRARKNAAVGPALGRLVASDDPRITAADAGTLERVEYFIQRVAALRHKEAQHGALGAPRPEAEQVAARTRDAISALCAWLAAEPDDARPLGRGVVLGLAGLFVVAGAALALAADPRLALIAVLALGALVALNEFLSRRRTWPARDAARTRHERLGAAAPAAWDPSGVQAALDARIEELAGLRVEAERHARAAGLRREIEMERQELAQERAALQHELGVRDGAGDLTLAEVASALHQARTATMEAAAAQAVQDGLTERRDAALTALAAAFAREGFVPPADAIAAAARYDELASRNAEWVRRRDECVRLDLELAAARQAATRHEAALNQLHERLGLAPGDADGLAALVAAQPRFVALSADIERAATDRDRLVAALAATPGLTAMDAAQLRSAREEAASAADGLSALEQELGAAQSELRRARESRDYEDARDAAARAEDRLVALRDDSLYASAGRVLLGELRARVERVARPPVLQRATDWFLAFTRGAYRFDVAGDGESAARFSALDLSRAEERALSELSDGTRLQLLLAARLAFAAHVEGERPLPLFLDEVLSNSDPARAAAILDALLVLTADGTRQVFYMTSNPADVGLLAGACERAGRPAPAVVDVAAVRGRGVTPLTPGELVVPRPPAIPQPGTMSVEEYGVATGAAFPAPGDARAALHVFHVLRPDLPLVYKALQLLEAPTRGILEAALDRPAARTLLSADEIERMRAWIALTDAVADGWDIGRGKIVDRAVLESSGAASDTYLDVLADLAQDARGDARLFLEWVTGPRRPPRFAEKKLEQLKRYLMHAEYVDDRERLDREGLVRYALDRVASLVDARRLSTDDVRRRVAEWIALMERRAPGMAHSEDHA